VVRLYIYIHVGLKQFTGQAVISTSRAQSAIYSILYKMNVKIPQHENYDILEMREYLWLN